MSSTNSTKPEFVEGLPWGQILFWVAAVVAIPLFLVWSLLQTIFEKAGNSSHPYTPTDEDEKTQAEIDARARRPIGDTWHGHEQMRRSRHEHCCAAAHKGGIDLNGLAQ